MTRTLTLRPTIMIPVFAAKHAELLGRGLLGSLAVLLLLISGGCGGPMSVQISPGQQLPAGTGFAFARARVYNEGQLQTGDFGSDLLTLFFNNSDGKQFTVSPIKGGMVYIAAPPGRYGPVVAQIFCPAQALGLTFDNNKTLVATIQNLFIQVPAGANPVYIGDLSISIETNHAFHLGQPPIVVKGFQLVASQESIDTYRRDFPNLPAGPATPNIPKAGSVQPLGGQ